MPAGVFQAEAFVAGRHGGLAPGLAEVLRTTFVSVFNLSAAPTLLLAVGFAPPLLRGHGGLGRCWGWTLLVVAVAHAGAVCSVAGRGVFTPAGLFTYVAPSLYTLWILLASHPSQYRVIFERRFLPLWDDEQRPMADTGPLRGGRSR